MTQKTIYWHLPGFCYFRQLNLATITLMKEYPNCFRPGYKIGSVYGTFPGAIWNGGRVVMGLAGKRDIETTLKLYNSKGVPVRFTWTNSVLEEKHIYDTYCNLIMRLADNGMNQVLVNAPVLEEYIRREYPNYKLISSTTKRINETGGVLAELEKDYFLVVLDYDLNHDEKTLEAIGSEAGRVELLVNEVCSPGCPLRAEHYAQQSRAQLEFDVGELFHCPNSNQQKGFSECMKRPAFISNEEIGSYVDKGFVNFKIAGRGMPQNYVYEAYLYFLVKEDQRDFIRRRTDELMQKYRQTAGAR
ncbi:MAG: hypothetical protein J1E01_04085 [Acetatifactor sp.]|nr:hypothetical protein [Acetatifactor sp.]